MIPASVHEVYTVEHLAREGSSTVVVLKAQEHERYLPLYVANEQAYSIAVQLRNHHQERPRTYGLMAKLVEILGGKVESVAITMQRDDVYYAVLRVAANGVEHEVDCRPSDALALALQVNAPIFVAPDLLQQPGMQNASVLLDDLFGPSSVTLRNIKPLELNRPN